MSRHTDFYVELFRTWHTADKMYGEQEQDIHPGLALGLVVLMEDEIIHTDEHPLCSDSTCPCHEEGEDRPAPPRFFGDVLAQFDE